MQRPVKFGSIFIFICLLTTACGPSASVDPVPIESTCFICPDTANLSGLIADTETDSAFGTSLSLYLEQAQSAPDRLNPVIVRLNIRDFCQTPKVSGIQSISNTYLEQFEVIASKIQSCPDRCTADINEAEYCAFGNRLTTQSESWPALSTAYMDAAIFLELADEKNQPAISYLSNMLDGASREALTHLDANLSALLDNTPVDRGAITVGAAISDLREASNILQVLHWAGLADAAAIDHSRMLSIISTELTQLPDDIDLALTRAIVLEPGQRVLLAQRLIDLYTNIVFVRRSIVASAGTLTEIEPNTTANAANPLAENSLNVQSAAACFNRLGMELSIVSEFSRTVKDELATCRSFAACPGTPLNAGSADMWMPTDRFNARIDKDQKLALSVSNSLCQ